MVTKPLSASSKTDADTVVLIGTPSLLSFMAKVNHEKEGKVKKHKEICSYVLSIQQRKGLESEEEEKHIQSCYLKSAANIVLTAPKLERSNSNSWLSVSTAYT